MKNDKKQVSGFGKVFGEKDIYKCPFCNSAH